MKEEGIRRYKLFVSMFVIVGMVVVGVVPLNTLAAGSLPGYDIEQDSLGNYHKAYIDDITGIYEIYYTNDIGGGYPQDWNPPIRITYTPTESMLLDLGIYLDTDTIFIIWQETDRYYSNIVMDYPTYYTISQDYGENWMEPRRSYEEIMLKYANFDPLFEEPVLPSVPDCYTSTYGCYIVQMKTPMIPEWREGIEAAGGTIFEYIPNNANIVKMTPLALDAVDNLPYIRWIGLYHPMYKFSEGLRSIVEYGGSHVDVSIDLMVFENMNSVVTQIIALGGTIVEESDPYLRVTIDDTKLYDIALIPDTHWIEETPQYQLFNDLATVTMNIDDVWTNLPESLTGEGQVIAIADTGLDIGVNDATLHDDFEGRLLNTYALGRPGDWSDQNGHGTHVAGSALGNGASFQGTGTPDRGQYSGGAYESQLVMQSIMDANGRLGGLPLDLGTLFTNPYTNDGARIHSNSWGTANNGQYTADSHEVDTFMWNNRDMLILFAAGNEGVDGDSDGEVDLDSLCDPGTAKNVLTVGASENNRNPQIGDTYGAWWPADFPVPPIFNDPMANNVNGMAAFSSRGPPDAPVAGRIKPDIVAPGTFILSTRSQQWAINEDVETGAPTWTTGGTSNWGLSNNANGGFFSFTDSPGVGINYANGADNFWDSPIIDLRTGGDTIRFWSQHFLAPNDEARIEIHYQNFFVWGALTGNQPAFTESIFNLPTDQQIIGWGFNPLVEKQNVWIRFRLVDTVDGNTADGWYVDDVRIYSRMWGRSTRIGAASGGPQDENYILAGGTSMATPLTAGAATLARQYYVDHHNINPSAALLKATLINGATDMPGQGYGLGNGATEPIPNFHEGWGRVDLSNSIFPAQPRIMRFWDEDPDPIDGRIFNSALDPTDVFSITNCDPAEELRITLVWTDAPSSPGVSAALENNLDLRVTDQSTGTTVSYGNDFTGGSSNTHTPPPATPPWDTENTVECVYIPDPRPEYTIEVIPTTINTPGQTYALVISYGQAPLTINLYAEWNLISLPLDPENPYITEVLSSIDGLYTSVQSYDASDVSDPWKHYAPSKPPHMNDLWYLYSDMGFFIYIPSGNIPTPPGYLTLEVYGAHFSENHVIEIFPGWNMVGYPSTENEYYVTALNTLDYPIDINSIWYLDAPTQDDKEIPIDYDTFEVGRGYWFHAVGTPPDWEVIWDYP